MILGKLIVLNGISACKMAIWLKNKGRVIMLVETDSLAAKLQRVKGCYHRRMQKSRSDQLRKVMMDNVRAQNAPFKCV